MVWAGGWWLWDWPRPECQTTIVVIAIPGSTDVAQDKSALRGGPEPVAFSYGLSPRG